MQYHRFTRLTAVLSAFLQAAASARRQDRQPHVAARYQQLRKQLAPLPQVDCENAFPKAPQ